jgi:hypothetical protein
MRELAMQPDISDQASNNIHHRPLALDPNCVISHKGDIAPAE